MFSQMHILVVQILFCKSSQQGVLDVLSGVADAAFARADLLDDMQYAGMINASDFKCVTAVSRHFLHHLSTPPLLPLSCY